MKRLQPVLPKLQLVVHSVALWFLMELLDVVQMLQF
jgi:hypothetical protein